MPRLLALFARWLVRLTDPHAPTAPTLARRSMHPQHHVDYSARRPAPAAAPVRHVSPVLTGFPRGVHEVATCDGYRCLQAIDSRGVLVEEYRGRADLFARRLPVVFARLWEALEQADPVSAARHLAIVGAG